jgi:methyl-accepting chemotaxis protein
MEGIPSWYWMTIITFLTALFGLILYYVAMLVKETTSTMSEVKVTIADSRKLIQNANQIVEDVQDTVSNVKGTIDQLNESILQPVKQVGDMVKGFLGSIK